jgi:hypothetical protein
MTIICDNIIALPARGEILRRRALKVSREKEGQQRHLLLERAVTLAIARLHRALAHKFPGDAYAIMADREANEGQALSEALVCLQGRDRRP